ncbi:phage portal protein [Hazenella sp. IB182357]|uniref:Phage portal protein n=1 Tax=Polycladospora coralii TaxID=2771432 RepID=A0A926NCH5_9BACL|nr:phage portal protein [Polycladospora coralii]MBD1373722.1 phage portal protein [Polycladospora coralii]
MNLWQRFKAAVTPSKEGAYKGQGYDFTSWQSRGSRFFDTHNGDLASNETVFSAITRLSNSLASLPLKLNRNFEPVNNHIGDLIATSPNLNMTSFDFVRTMETHRNTYGNAYALKMYDTRYQIESLHILDPTLVSPIIETTTNDLWYEVHGDKGRYYVHNMDMIHVKHIYSKGYKGISPVDVLKNTVAFDKEVRQFSLDQMDSSVKASFILKYATNLDDKKRGDIRDNFKAFYKDNGGVLFQESGYEVEPIDRKFIDTKVFEVEKITRARVATVFNIPLHFLAETDGASFSSMEQMSLEYVQNTLIPIVRMYEQELNRKLLTDKDRLQGLSFKFNVNGLLRGDTQTRAEFYFKGIRSGWFTPNEIRAYEELPPVEGGDQLYISGDLYPIDTPIEQRNSKTTTTTPSKGGG